MPRLLELFCGTKSIGRAFEAAGWEVVSRRLEEGDALVLRALEIMEHFDPLMSGSRCDAWEDGRHLRGAQGGPRLMGGQRERVRGQSRELLYSIPTALCEEIASAATAWACFYYPEVCL